MLQVAFIKQNTDFVKERLSVKHFAELSLIDEIIALDDQRKQTQSQFDNNQSQVNSLSKEIGQLMAKGEKVLAEEKKTQVGELKATLEPIKQQLTSIEQTLETLLTRIPNLPAPIVPTGKTPEDNIVAKEGGKQVQLPENAVPHWDLAKQYRLIDFELGNKITGSGFPVYTGVGARLQRALIQYFLDFNTAEGYVEMTPPLMVNEASAFGTGQLPDKEGQMYHVTEDKFYMIPTSEVPLTNIYRDELLKESELPVKMTAYTPCFRREAGSYGKDVRGLNRLHQFDKVEIVQLTKPELSYQTLDEMVAHVEKLIISLELPYRILRLCGGDMSFTSALTYDFEVYSAAQEKWLEVSSVSNFETYQANRMKVRFKDGNGKNQLVHTLNGSSLALPRILACLLENNQTAEGIKIPAALQKYFGKDIISA